MFTCTEYLPNETHTHTPTYTGNQAITLRGQKALSHAEQRVIT